MFSIVTFSVETIPDLKPQTRMLLWAIEWFSVIVFTLEYLLRIYVADSKPRFVFSFLALTKSVDKNEGSK